MSALKYMVTVSGCDDSTSVVIDLTEAEAAAVYRVARVVTEASSYCCEPTMTVHLDPLEEDGDS